MSASEGEAARLREHRTGFLYLRHGETDWNAAGRAQGRSDIPLNGNGRTQAREAGHALEAVPVGRIVCSPLSRALETARIVQAHLQRDGAAVPLETEPGLQEVSFGRHEGEPMGEWYEAWLAGGEAADAGMERFDDLVTRASVALLRHLDRQEAAAPVLFVAHGALFRAVRRALGLRIDQRLANGVPLACRPGAQGWSVEPAG